MKRFDFPLDEFQVARLFEVIRDKRGVIILLMRAIKIMLLATPVQSEKVAGRMILSISKWSRLFFITESKIFTVNFPFFATEGEEGLMFKSHYHPYVDNRLTSNVIGLLEMPLLSLPDVISFSDPICEIEDSDSDFWALFRELMLFEDGYLRYDKDEARANGHVHPLHHLDVFYSQGNAIKIGLAAEIEIEGLTNMLDPSTDCHYLRPL